MTPPSGKTLEAQPPIIFGLSPNIFVQPGEIFAPTKPEKKIEEEPSLTFLWSIALALYGFGDTFSSVLAFTKGGVEANPILATLLGWFDGSIAAFTLIKMLILLGLLFLSYLAPKQGWIIPFS